jgi:hypothetical protein
MLNPPLSKNAAYRAAERGEIPTLRFGHLLRVPGKKWRRMLNGERPFVPDAALVCRCASEIDLEGVEAKWLAGTPMELDKYAPW